MNIIFKIIPTSEIEAILPFLKQLNRNRIEVETLHKRVLEMVQQSYECIGIYHAKKLIGICGLWFQTRHYAGKSVETDHIYIDEAYQSKGIGKQLFHFIEEYAHTKKCNWIELNTYVSNTPSHKFYYNLGFEIRGYHFVKEIN
ncbi:MAG: GNAT family N-acetyltransferase [Flavobacteriales bacterium]